MKLLDIFLIDLIYSLFCALVLYSLSTVRFTQHWKSKQLPGLLLNFLITWLTCCATSCIIHYHVPVTKRKNKKDLLNLTLQICLEKWLFFYLKQLIFYFLIVFFFLGKIFLLNELFSFFKCIDFFFFVSWKIIVYSVIEKVFSCYYHVDDIFVGC